MMKIKRNQRQLLHIKRKAIRSVKKSLIKPKRPVHRKVVLNPLFEFAVLCFGVVLVASSLAAAADQINLSAVIPAKLLTTSATIDSIQNNNIMTSSPIAIFGTCPINSYIELLRNHYISGVSYCLSTGLYEIQTDLTPGVNHLVAQAYNFDNIAGPASPQIRIIYNAPVIKSLSATVAPAASQPIVEVANSPITPTDTQSNQPGIGSLLLTAQYHYQAFTTQNTYSWQMNLSGGAPPYSVSADWGDGSKSNFFFNTDPVFTITHHYANSGTFAVVVNSVDNLQEKVVFQLTAMIRESGSSKVAVNKVKNNSGVITIVNKLGLLKYAHRLMWLIWPSYLIIVLMVISFRLGEKRQLQRLLTGHVFRK
jgi:hypothetical protein